MRKRFILPLLCSLLSLTGCEQSQPEPQKKGADENRRNWYEIFVGSFADSDGDGIGDLQGVIDKLDYIEKLNFDGIWLMPIFESPSYHKYDMEDYFKIDPDYGTEEDLKELVAACHERGIKVIIDLALNHSSLQNDWFKTAAAAYAHVNLGATDDDSLLSGLTEEEIADWAELYSFAPLPTGSIPSGWARVPNRNFIYECNFSTDMPEFNFDSELAWDKFSEIIKYWMDPEHGDVDGYRLDAVLYYYLNDTAKNSAALKKIEEIGKEADPNCYFVGEAWLTDPAALTSYYQQSGLDSFFWFPGSTSSSSGFILNALGYGGTNKDRYYDGQKTMIEAAGDHIPAPFVDNHDIDRSFSSNLTIAKFQYGLLATCSGNTFTYYGDECGIGENNQGRDEDIRTHMPWGDDYECSDPAMAAEATMNFGTVAAQLEDESSLVNYVREANRLRNLYPALGWGDIVGEYQAYDGKAGIMGVDKELDGQKVRIVYNFDATGEQSYEPQAGEELVGSLVSQGEVRKDGDSYLIPGYSIALFAQN